MQVQIKRRFMILLDEDEAEEFLDDPTDVQTRVRDQLRANGNGTQGTQTHTARVAPPAPVKRGRPSKRAVAALPKAKQHRAPQPVACPDCGAKMDPRGLPTHRRKLHGSEMSAIAHAADGPSAG